MSLYKDNITLFTFHPSTEKWYPHIICGVHFLATDSKKATQNSGITAEDTAKVYVRCTSGKIINTQAGEEQYVSQKEYTKLTDPTGYITFTPESDFFILGASEETVANQNGSWQAPVQEGTNLYIRMLDFSYVRNEYNEPIADNEYESGLYNDMNSKYDGVYKITTSAFFGLIPHFEIGGR